MTLNGPLVTVMLCYGISYLHTPSAIQKYTWKSCVFYLLYSHVIAEHGGTKEKGGITSHQLSLYTSKILPEHILDTFLDLGLKGPEGSRAPESKRVCIWYWPWQAFPASFQENNWQPNLLVTKYVFCLAKHYTCYTVFHTQLRIGQGCKNLLSSVKHF